MFKVDQKKVYNEFIGQTGSNNGDIPTAEESRTSWSGIFSVEKKHNKEVLNGWVIWKKKWWN